MDTKNYDEVDAQNLKWGAMHLFTFMVLIVAVIVSKRVYGHPEYMMLFHGPAAIFLVVGGLKVSAKQRRRFQHIEID